MISNKMLVAVLAASVAAVVIQVIGNTPALATLAGIAVLVGVTMYSAITLLES